LTNNQKVVKKIFLGRQNLTSQKTERFSYYKFWSLERSGPLSSPCFISLKILKLKTKENIALVVHQPWKFIFGRSLGSEL